jgi:hypothetical protein
MKNYTHKLAILSSFIGLIGFSVSPTFALTRAEVSAQNSQITADYKAEEAVCKKESGNAKDICNQQAKGKVRIARAELDLSQSDTPKNMSRVAVAKADAIFNVAKEKCDDSIGNEKALCRTEAKSAHNKSLADAKLGKTVSTATTKDINTRMDADYKIEIEKCASMASDAKTACIQAARTQFKR